MGHRNARLTVHGRRLLVERVQAGMPVAHVGIHCPNTSLVVFVTSHWKWSDWRRHEREVRRIKARFVVVMGDEPGSFVRVV